MRVLWAALFLISASICQATEEIKAADPNEGWKPAGETDGITIFSRPHPDSKLKEFKAIGGIDAPARIARAVIADFDAYPSFMPYTAECRLIKREPDAIITYQRLSPKIVSDRDYTLRVRWTSWPGPGGQVYANKWEQANALGPPAKSGVERVKVCDGGWVLEPDGANKTKATYSIYTDSGGMIPAFLANHASKIGIEKLFAAIRKQVKVPKYAEAEHSTAN
jgi:hypothetical protein